MKLATSGRYLQIKKDRGRLAGKMSRGKPEDLAGSKKLWGVKNNDRKRIFNQ
jgi:hypothetical protein